MNNNTKSIIIFAREPIAGTVKSRLAPVLNELERLTLYKRMLRHISAVVSQVEVCVGHIFSTPSIDHPVLKDIANLYHFQQKPQSKGDLGSKMSSAMSTVLSGADKALIIGSDCPFITPDYLRSALTQLDRNEVVIGPAEDGGFVMIGARTQNQLGSLFEGVNWGSEEVLDQVCENAKKAEISLFHMPVLNDIDRPEDLALLENFTWFE